VRVADPLTAICKADHGPAVWTVKAASADLPAATGEAAWPLRCRLACGVHRLVRALGAAPGVRGMRGMRDTPGRIDSLQCKAAS
jgi:hypothetical protein